MGIKMRKTSKILGALPALALTFQLIASPQPVQAQEAGYIHEVIKGRTANIKCEKAFPDGKNPEAGLIAWIDKNYYHFRDGKSPISYALMDESEREEFLADTNRMNWPLYRYTAQIYDNSSDKVQVLKRLLAESHSDFPASRWDDMAEKCALSH